MGRQYSVFLFRRGTEQPHPRAIWTLLLHRTCSLSTKNTFWGRNQIRRSTTILQLLICVQHKMAGDDYPFILQCLVYCKKGTFHHWGILTTHPSLKLPSFYVCQTSSGQLLGLPQISLESIRLPSFYVCRTSSGQLLGFPKLSLGSTGPPLPKY